MRIRRVLKATALAAALTFSSCHFQKRDPVVEKPHIVLIRKVPERIIKQYGILIKEYRRRKRKSSEMATRWKDYFGKREKRQLYSCESGLVMPGGLNSHVFVFLQSHRSPSTDKMPLESVKSQLMIYRVLASIAKKHGIRTVIIEGLPNTQFLRSKEGIDWADKTFKQCIHEARYLLQNRSPNSFKEKEIEDVCLMSFFPKGADLGHIGLLMLDNPDIKIAGFEIDNKTYKQAMQALNEIGQKIQQEDKDSGKQSDREGSYSPWGFFSALIYNLLRDRPDFRGIKKIIEESIELQRKTEEMYKTINKDPNRTGYLSIINFKEIIYDPEIAPNLDPKWVKKILSVIVKRIGMSKEMADLWLKEFELEHKYGKFILNTRSRYAVDSIISHSSQNTALLIGKNHMISMMEALMRIPHDKRPTVHFLEDECTNRDSFVTSPERMSAIVDLLVEEQKNESPK